MTNGDYDNVTVTTMNSCNDDCTIMSGATKLLSGEDTDNEDEDFAVENAPRPPPTELLYNGRGAYIRSFDNVGAQNSATEKRADVPPLEKRKRYANDDEAQPAGDMQ